VAGVRGSSAVVIRIPLWRRPGRSANGAASRPMTA
jgi:hypothetical protein